LSVRERETPPLICSVSLFPAKRESAKRRKRKRAEAPWVKRERGERETGRERERERKERGREVEVDGRNQELFRTTTFDFHQAPFSFLSPFFLLPLATQQHERHRHARRLSQQRHLLPRGGGPGRPRIRRGRPAPPLRRRHHPQEHIVVVLLQAQRRRRRQRLVQDARRREGPLERGRGRR